ncbi:hypothetical protein PPACK8108_LOCUS4060, partial [Phakopsora pachyrhizi]
MKASAIISILTGELQSSSVCLLMTNSRKDSKKTDEEIEDQLEKTFSLYRHLNKKDLFEKYYKNHLAKRLLFVKSISEDTEQNMIIKLKVKSGSAFTRDSEGFKHKLLNASI